MKTIMAEIVTVIGVFMAFLGGMGMDSESQKIPAVMLLVGCFIIGGMYLLYWRYRIED